MNKIKVVCSRCNNPMDPVSFGGSSKNHLIKEIWDCSKCKLEVVVVYAEITR